MTAIEWTEKTLNLWDGCDKLDPACAFCYIDRTPPFRKAHRRFERGHIPIRYHLERLDQPRRRRVPTMYFVNQLGDSFHEDVATWVIDRMFAMFRDCPQHTFQVLTKRTERMRDYILERTDPSACVYAPWLPLPNVWLGTTIGTIKFTWRADVLRQTPAAVRFISAEPLLGPLAFGRYKRRDYPGKLHDTLYEPGLEPFLRDIDWLIVGGESGGPDYRRLVENKGGVWFPKERALEWVSDLRDAAHAAGTAFFLKQWGGPRPTSGGRLLDGRIWDEFPVAREAVPA